jgi:hypothetical protein
MASWYTSPFGNGKLVGSGGNVTSNVHNNFGPRDIKNDGSMGVNKIEGIKEELIVYVTGDMFTDVPDTLMPYTLPEGAILKAAYVDVVEAFALGGTTPTILIGENGAEVTNGLVISEAIAEGTGSHNLTATFAGEWDSEAPLPHRHTIGIALGGSNPTITRAGRLRVTILFDRVNKIVSPALPQ